VYRDCQRMTVCPDGVAGSLMSNALPWQGRHHCQSIHGLHHSSWCESSEPPAHQYFWSHLCPRHRHTDHTYSSIKQTSRTKTFLRERNHNRAADLYGDLYVQIIRHTWELWSARCGLAGRGRWVDHLPHPQGLLSWTRVRLQQRQRQCARD